MALRDQPYLPLFVKDFMTDEKLMICTASTTGVYIRLMCVMHKSEAYGTILLKQKFKQSNKQINNFALQLANFMPYDLQCIESALTELIDEEIIKLDGDLIIQKRMVKDSDISEKRANAGKKGGEETQKSKPKNNKKFAKAKNKANTAIENEIVTETTILKLDLNVDTIHKKIIDYLNLVAETDFKISTKTTIQLIDARIEDGFEVNDFFTVIDKMVNKWQFDSNMCQYIRPQTLFGTKFESYLNAIHTVKYDESNSKAMKILKQSQQFKSQFQ